MSAQAAHGKRKSSKEKRTKLVQLTEAQAAASWSVLLALAFLLGAIYLFQTSQIARVGRRVQELQNLLDDAKQENAMLEQQIAEAQSLERLQQEAASLGFVRATPQDVEYLVIPNYPAPTGTELTAETSTVLPSVQTIGEALWMVVQSSVGSLMRGESR